MDFLNTLKVLAPTVASAFGTPLAGLAVSAIGSIFGMTDATQAKISDVITNGQMTPDNVAEIKKLELQYKNDEQERGFKYADLAFKNVADARGRDVEYVKSGGHNYRADVLAYGALLAFGASGYVLFTQVLPTNNRELIVYLLGALTVIVKDLYGFEFGSSSSSHEKDNTISNLTAPVPDVVSVVN